MCLFKDKGFHSNNRPLIAEKDIICYKKIQQVGRNAYITPCTYTQIPIECIQDKVPFKAVILSRFKFIWRHILGFSDIVTDGFIHTFSSVPLYFDLSRNNRVFKCIIPKGTIYFIGDDGDYASKQIIFVEQLK